MNEFIFSVLSFLVLTCFGTQWMSSLTKPHQTAISLNNDPEFRKFQRRFFAPYFLVLFSDWLQGPYVYRLYKQYGISSKDITLLYIVGFGSSVIFSTFTGLLADRFGRKRLCLVFCCIYSLCCLTKLSQHFWWLLFGRFFGGLSTSIWFSTFEAWYVCHHSVSGYPAEWISSTFSISTFWNGLLAILAGIVADFGAVWLGFGPIAPFITAIPLVVLGGIIITINWEENYGSNEFDGYNHSLFEGLRVIISDKTILLLGLVQSMFESIMYTFIFLWTPVLDASNSSTSWPLGLVFSCFMVCIMIGSTVNNPLLNLGIYPYTVLLAAVSCSIISMVICLWATDSNNSIPFTSFFAFIIFEIAVGMYLPSMGYLRCQVIPEVHRANIMNWLRVPLNVITCAALYCLHENNGLESSSDNQTYRNAFIFNIILGFIGLVGAILFWKTFVVEIKESYYKISTDTIVDVKADGENANKC